MLKQFLSAVMTSAVAASLILIPTAARADDYQQCLSDANSIRSQSAPSTQNDIRWSNRVKGCEKFRAQKVCLEGAAAQRQSAIRGKAADQQRVKAADQQWVKASKACQYLRY